MSQPLIVLTGASGRLGAGVHRALLDAGMNVRATDRFRIDPAGPPLIKANLLHPPTCRRMMEGAQVLIHLAYRREPFGYPNGYPHTTFDDHIRLNRHVFQAACEAGVKKIIFSSTVQVIARQSPGLSGDNPPHYLPLDENSPPEPDNWYGLVKLCSEQMLGTFRRTHGIDYVILRFPALVNTVPVPPGEWYKTRRSEAFSYLSYLDAAALIRKVVETDLPGARTYFPASRKNLLGLSPAEVIRQYYPGIPLRKPPSEMESLVDISTVTRDLGWEPRDLSQPDGKPFMPLVWRIYLRTVKLVPKSLRPAVERALVAFE
jgi:nucleoside-diphosphate-sugar epimerase